ncbi:DUF1120 domain-containing protein [Enterobacter asburiae]|uniref:DUF1120 domain-containing protein n=1 Tax=Scandinavium sp. UTDF21-P1B TaxID=3446379 RepID=UPI00349963FE
MKTTTISKTLLATLLAAVAGQAMAEGDSVDVKVRGQFVPAACTTTVSGGGTVDYGTIKAETIAKDDFTMLAVKNLNLSIACEAPMKIALYGKDLRADSRVLISGKSWNVKAGSVTTDIDYGSFGLGKSDNKPIGAWAMWMEPETVKADGNIVDTIRATQFGDTPSQLDWETSPTSGVIWPARNGTVFSWAAPGTMTPIALTTLNGTLSVQAGINKGSELDLTKTVTLDGMATIQVFYL